MQQNRPGNYKKTDWAYHTRQPTFSEGQINHASAFSPSPSVKSFRASQRELFIIHRRAFTSEHQSKLSTNQERIWGDEEIMATLSYMRCHEPEDLQAAPGKGSLISLCPLGNAAEICHLLYYPLVPFFFYFSNLILIQV